MRLLDCFLLVTPVVSDAFGAFLLDADSGADFFTVVGIFGAGSDAFRAYEGDAMVTVSAICHDEEMRYVCAPAQSDIYGQQLLSVTGQPRSSSRLRNRGRGMLAI